MECNRFCRKTGLPLTQPTEKCWPKPKPLKHPFYFQIGRYAISNWCKLILSTIPTTHAFNGFEHAIAMGLG
jgi:hypothetical protein